MLDESLATSTKAMSDQTVGIIPYLLHLVRHSISLSSLTAFF